MAGHLFEQDPDKTDGDLRTNPAPLFRPECTDNAGHRPTKQNK